MPAGSRNVGRVDFRRVADAALASLESLLADAALLSGTLSLVEFAREMVGVTETAVRPIASSSTRTGS